MKRKGKKHARRHGFRLALVVLTLVILFWGWMFTQARTVRLMRAMVSIQDLPPAFEGKTILYVSDIDIGGTASPAATAEVILRTEALHPDMLILGGDYNTHTLTEILDQASDLSETALRHRERFFEVLSRYEAPLGKFALVAPEDGDALPSLLERFGFLTLNDARFRIDLNGDALWLVGINERSEGISRGARSFQRNDCVIAISDSPARFPMLNTAEASDGGHWVDLCLAGHTHGGQIRLLGRNLLQLNPLEQQYLYGWTRETGVPMLTTSGLGCEGIGLRLGTQSEIWLITLTR